MWIGLPAAQDFLQICEGRRIDRGCEPCRPQSLEESGLVISVERDNVRRQPPRASAVFDRIPEASQPGSLAADDVVHFAFRHNDLIRGWGGRMVSGLSLADLCWVEFHLPNGKDA